MGMNETVNSNADSLISKTLSKSALSVIDSYLNFRLGTAVCSVPYFNNKTIKARAALGVFVGKGTPKEILEELLVQIHKSHLNAASINNDTLKRLLTDNNLGVDCSGFAYRVLNAESEALGKGSLERHLQFAGLGFAGRLRAALSPVKNTDVTTFADDANSRQVNLSEVEPGDFISMTEGPEGADRNHILVIHQVDCENSPGGVLKPVKIYYSDAVAYPEDGVYGTGIKQGTITIKDLSKPITEALWSENNSEGAELEGEKNRMFARALKSKTEVRRLRWF
jgi:hypothetical protein